VPVEYRDVFVACHLRVLYINRSPSQDAGRNKRSVLRNFISNTLAEVTVEPAGFRAGLAQCAEFIIGPAHRVRPLAGPMAGSGRTRWLIAPYGPSAQARLTEGAGDMSG
jgi:hypothetical protein